MKENSKMYKVLDEYKKYLNMLTHPKIFQIDSLLKNQREQIIIISLNNPNETIELFKDTSIDIQLKLQLFNIIANVRKSPDSIPIFMGFHYHNSIIKAIVNLNGHYKQMLDHPERYD